MNQTKSIMTPSSPPVARGLPSFAVVSGCGARGRGHHHWLLLLLPRGQELQNHGLLQENGATGMLMVFGVVPELSESISRPSSRAYTLT